MRGVTALPRLCEPLNRLEELGRLLVRLRRVARGERAGDAVLHVILEHLDPDRLEGGVDGSELGENVDAVAVVLDHLGDASHLPLDPGEPLQELLLVRCVAVGPGRRFRRHAEYRSIPPHGI